jgi:acetyltransferase-like isoleucine patch superfamily enzyme
MRRRLRVMLIGIIALVPGNAFRILLYRLLLGYKIDSRSRIGMFNYIDVEECQLHGASIGRFNEVRAGSLTMRPESSLRRFNRIRFANRVTLAEQSVLVSRNTIIGTFGDISPYKAHENFSLGVGSIVTIGHHFDISDSITIDDNVTFGGNACQIWTHGFDPGHVKIQGPISIGRNVYVGSGSIILQGLKIADDVSIGAGTVVSKSITETGFYVSSGLVRKGAVGNYGDDPDLVSSRGYKFLRRMPKVE